jgi:hypothetical protein
MTVPVGVVRRWFRNCPIPGTAADPVTLTTARTDVDTALAHLGRACRTSPAQRSD